VKKNAILVGSFMLFLYDNLMSDNKVLKSIISVEKVHFSYESKVVFQGLNLTIPRGQVTAIMGPSGIGKTTLLSLMTGQLTPDQGGISFLGKDISQFSQKKRYAMRRKMGFLFQGGALFTDVNVFDNVAFGLREHMRLPEDMVRDMVLMMLEAVGLRGAAGLYIYELSGGMARRVALARALIMNPDLMIYDEPFAGQDPVSRGVLRSLIHKMNRVLKLTSLIVSHDVNEVIEVADYVYLIYQGEVLASGEPRSLLSHDSPLVQQFVQGLPDGPLSFHYPAPTLAEDFLC
jgi:phospholipid/cholesterol/gamma-HCH transport system ATP-binding protein